MSTNKTIFNPLLPAGFQKLSTSAETFAGFTHEPTGFLDPNNVVSTDDLVNRTLTLSHASGFVRFAIFGTEYSYASPWVVPTVLGGATPITHANANGAYFCKININTLAITFDTAPFNFETDMMLGFAIKGPTYHWFQRETHGVMPWQCHESDHWTKGSYIHTAAVATAGTYAVLTGPTATNAANTPGFDLTDIHDEDLETNIAAWIEGTYTTAHRLGVGGVWTISTVATSPFLIGASTFIQYNLNTAGTWSLADVPEDNYVNILVAALPAAASADSQKYRLMFFTGQTVYSTLSAAQAATALNWDFGSFISDLPEFCPIMMLTYQKASSGGNTVPAGVTGRCWLCAEPLKIIGTSRNLTGIGGVAPSDHQALSNRTALDAHPIGSITPLTAGKVIVGDGTATGLTEATTTTTEVQVLAGNIANAFKLVGFDSAGATRVDGTDAHILAMGTTAQRATGANGMIRYNTDINAHEVYQADISGWGMVGSRWKTGSFVLAGSSVFAPPTAAGIACLGFEMLLRIKRTSDSKEELLQIYSVFENGTTWTFSVVSVAGTDLAVTIAQLSAGQIQLAGFDGTYKLRVSGFIFA